MLVLFAEPHHDDICSSDGVAGPYEVYIGALVVMPELVRLLAQDPDPAFVARRMVSYRAGKDGVEAVRALSNLVAPVGMDFTGKIDGQ